MRLGLHQRRLNHHPLSTSEGCSPAVGCRSVSGRRHRPCRQPVCGTVQHAVSGRSSLRTDMSRERHIMRFNRSRAPTTTGRMERIHQTLSRELLDSAGAFVSIEVGNEAIDNLAHGHPLTPSNVRTRRARRLLTMWASDRSIHMVLDGAESGPMCGRSTLASKPIATLLVRYRSLCPMIHSSTLAPRKGIG